MWGTTGVSEWQMRPQGQRWTRGGRLFLEGRRARLVPGGLELCENLQRQRRFVGSAQQNAQRFAEVHAVPSVGEQRRLILEPTQPVISSAASNKVVRGLPIRLSVPLSSRARLFA